MQVAKLGSKCRQQSQVAVAGSKELESKVELVSTMSVMRELFSVLVCLPQARWRGAKKDGSLLELTNRIALDKLDSVVFAYGDWTTFVEVN